MATQTLSTTSSISTQRGSWVRYVFYEDAAFCAGLGALGLVFNTSVSAELGLPSAALVVLSIALIGYALVPLLIGLQRPLDPNKVILSAVLDDVWILATIFLLVTNALPMTSQGVLIAVVVAVITAVIGVSKFVAWRAMRS